MTLPPQVAANPRGPSRRVARFTQIVDDGVVPLQFDEGMMDDDGNMDEDDGD